MIDHIVLAVADLAEAVADFERRTGIRAVAAGSHSDIGTANSLVGLGDALYLEIIRPDPEQADPALPRPFGIDALTASQVATWCIRPPELDRWIAQAVERGYDPGTPQAMSRRTPDGVVLTWRVTPGDPADGIVPFLIDWGTTAHPTTGALPTLPLVSLHAEHPTPERVQHKLRALDLDLPVRSGGQPRLVVTLQSATGPVMFS